MDQAYTFQSGQASLYSLIWKRLDSLLQGINTVYRAPTGVLHRLNLGAIPISPDQHFTDRHRLVLLGSNRSLALGTQVNQPATTPDAILFGGGTGNLGQEPVFKMSEQPMIRSGLILAGANRVWPGQEDRYAALSGYGPHSLWCCAQIAERCPPSKIRPQRQMKHRLLDHPRLDAPGIIGPYV